MSFSGRQYQFNTFGCSRWVANAEGNSLLSARCMANVKYQSRPVRRFQKLSVTALSNRRHSAAKFDRQQPVSSRHPLIAPLPDSSATAR